MGTQLPPPEKGGGAPSPIFGPCLLWPNARWIKVTLGMEVGFGPGHIALAPLPKKGAGPQFSARVYCGETAVCTKMPLSVELGLSPEDFVLDGDTAPLPKKEAEPPPQFSAHFYCGQTAACIKMPVGM